MKMRYFYKLDHNKQPIPGSNVRRKSKPGNQWKEILLPCCSPVTVPCTCGPRFFIQLDGLGKPVDGTLIKRFVYPNMVEGIKYYELPWKSVCCNEITWSFDTSNGATGSLVIEVNGNEVVNSTFDQDGSFKPNFGDTITITVTNTSVSDQSTTLVITGGHTFSDNDVLTVTNTFIWNGENTDIAGLIDFLG